MTCDSKINLYINGYDYRHENEQNKRTKAQKTRTPPKPEGETRPTFHKTGRTTSVTIDDRFTDNCKLCPASSNTPKIGTRCKQSVIEKFDNDRKIYIFLSTIMAISLYTQIHDR